MDKKYLIEMQPGGNRAMAFGLTWHTTLGNNPDAVAARLAAQEKAVAYTRGGARSTVVGLLRTKKRSELPAGRVELFSAAAVFARAFARGPVALRMAIPGGIWLTAAFDGVVVLGTDVIYEDAGQAQAHLDKLRERYKGLTVYGDQDGDRRMPPNALANQLDASTKLKRVSRSIAQVPLVVWAALGLLVVWVVADYGYGLYQDAQRAKREAERHVAVAVDPVASWRSAIHTWAQQVPNHGVNVLRTVLTDMEQVPLSAGRWELAEMDCNPHAWQCAARYKRGRLGTNEGLRQALPDEWMLHWPDLDNAVAQWRIAQPSPSQSLQIDSLMTAEDLTLSWASLLQRLSPALSDVALGDIAPVAITPPTQTQFDGTVGNIPLPTTAGVTLPAARDLIVNGPMRSLYLLDLPYGSTIEHIQIRRVPVGSAGLRASALTATLTGKIYAK